MHHDELNLIIQEGESLTVEFKESFSSKIDRDIVALANTKRIIKFIAAAKLPTPIIKSDSFFEIVFMRDSKFKVGMPSNTTDTELTIPENDLSVPDNLKS